MDEKGDDLMSNHQVLGRVDKMMTETSTNVDKSAGETVIESKRDEAACPGGESKDLEAMGCDLGSNKASVDGPGKMMGSSGEVSCRGEQGANEDSTNSDGGVVFETVVVINPAEAPLVGEDNREFSAKVAGLDSSKVPMEVSKKMVSEAEKQSCVININCGNGKGCGDKWDGERICRICHLSSDQSPDRTTATTVNSTVNLIHLGCGCKDELGIAHGHCAEAWFKLKGNRLCEICGETAKNITGVGDSRFMEEWNERTSTGSYPSDRNGGCFAFTW
ncbi:hypothetical protein FNV43_RR07389 [Rhamnella rubrinervis]|uniref:RING-CH-type domain-containing protein n=1 Tax=Rhamnella rubrinervis TaxID=2594499 RepID=A0A8K0MMC9_9ROSA|nr:hypothetical protein FNV43_RR07389 [Rhamnella rubrinervis]